MRKGTAKRRLPFDDMPTTNIHKGNLATKVDSKKKKKKTKTEDYIVTRMDLHKVYCKHCNTSQAIPATHNYIEFIKPIVDLFRERHSHG